MKIGVISNNARLVKFCLVLQDDGHEVIRINGQVPECDVLIYESQYSEHVAKITSCIKIEFHDAEPGILHQENSNLEVSFIPSNRCHQIKNWCGPLVQSQEKEVLKCNVSSIPTFQSTLNLLRPFIGSDIRVMPFFCIDCNTYLNCGMLNDSEVPNLMRSSDVSIVENRNISNLCSVLQYGGTPLVEKGNSFMELPDEFLFTTDDFGEKLNNLLNGKYPDLSKERKYVINTYNAYTQWSDIFKKVKLKLSSRSLKDLAEKRIKKL
jgi:hypothetical protein